MIVVSEENKFEIGQNYSFNQEKANIIFKGKGNTLFIGDNFKVDEIVAILVEGDNNNIFLGDNFNNAGQLVIVINGDYNNINLCDNIEIKNYLNINIIENSNNCSMQLGANSISNKANLNLNGVNNQIYIGDEFNNKEQMTTCVKGNDNKVYLGNNIAIENYLFLNVGETGKNRYIKVDDRTSFYKTDIQNYDNNSSVLIGQDCMFSYDTTVYNTDGHAIFQNGKLINQARECKIGNHVWVGWSATILKNCTIPDGTIVARNALVCKKFNKPNTIIAGIPAKVVKENVEWSSQTVNEVLDASKTSKVASY